MNKKLLALLLVSAMAVQIKAVGSDQEEEGSKTPPIEQQEQSNDVNNNDNSEKPVDSGAGALPQPNAPTSTPETARKLTTETVEADPAAAAAQKAPKITFVTPGKDDNAAIALLKRVRNKVWTVAVEDEKLTNILKDGAEHFKNFSASQKAEYYNAYDAQYGLKTTRFFKAAKLAMIATFVKIARDVIKEDTNEDDEDEA